MQLREIIVGKNPKDALLETIKVYQDKHVMIMMSKEVYEELTELNDFSYPMYFFDYICGPYDEVYEVYENERIMTCQKYGVAVFEEICGIFILKEFSSKIFNYYSENEAELCIYFKKE